MSEDLAKAAALARSELGERLAHCAAVLNAMGQMLIEATAGLNEAADAERQATQEYISALEKEICRQRELS